MSNREHEEIARAQQYLVKLVFLYWIFFLPLMPFAVIIRMRGCLVYYCFNDDKKKAEEQWFLENAAAIMVVFHDDRDKNI